MAKCQGTQEQHCCWVDGNVCPFFLDARASGLVGREIACALYLEKGSWDAVYQDQRYQELIQPIFNRLQRGDLGCGDWPINGEPCATCGAQD